MKRRLKSGTPSGSPYPSKGKLVDNAVYAGKHTRHDSRGAILDRRRLVDGHDRGAGSGHVSVGADEISDVPELR